MFWYAIIRQTRKSAIPSTHQSSTTDHRGRKYEKIISLETTNQSKYNQLNTLNLISVLHGVYYKLA